MTARIPQTQDERRRCLIEALLCETKELASAGVKIPDSPDEQRELLRTLFNIRPPRPASTAFLEVQDAYLKERIREKGVTDIAALTPIRDDVYLWQGDITTLKCGGIVNAANKELLGCFIPGHTCIDNAIHTFAGVQLRLECAKLMRQQGHQEPTGRAKITDAYNLPSRKILHTVGPIVVKKLSEDDERQLASCYTSVLQLARDNGLRSLALCCISTGVFHFPARRAAEIAVETVNAFSERFGSSMRIVYNVFTDEDYAIYHDILAGH